MFSRSLTVLARRRPPFAIFYKSMSPTLSATAAPNPMKLASVLWRRTAPKYGIRFSAPRVMAAKQIYAKEGHRLVKSMKTTAKPARRSRKSMAAKRLRKAPTTHKKSKSKSKSKKSPKRPKTTRSKAGLTKVAKKATTPYASFSSMVLKKSKLAATPKNKGRVFRLWLLTGQPRTLSLSNRVSMAVRLLRKDQRSKRKLSKKAARKAGKKQKSPTKRSAKTRKTKMAKKSYKSKTAKMARMTSAKRTTPRKVRLAARRKATARRRARSAATSKSKPRKTVVRSSKAKSATPGKPKARRVVSRKKTAHKKGPRSNPYIEFYRRVRMTGLLPNGPKVVGSRKIKELWARTHALPNIDARVAQATKILEAQTGAKAKTVASPTHAAPALVRLKDIRVPSYYEKNPFGATYAALLPMLQDIPTSTRMAHVAKAWTNTLRKDDHRSPKQRIAAVAQELKK